MTAVRKNLTTDRGTTFALSIRYKDSTGAPIDLTGHIVTFSMYKPGVANGAALFSKAAPVTSDGWINLRVTAVESAAFPLGKSAYRLDQLTPGGDTNRLLFGGLEVRSGVDV